MLRELSSKESILVVGGINAGEIKEYAFQTSTAFIGSQVGLITYTYYMERIVNAEGNAAVKVGGFILNYADYFTGAAAIAGAYAGWLLGKNLYSWHLNNQ